ncbi:MAG: polysaccharide pyruvyl transferase family protein [Thermogutta sp.]|nr:polysaccharide pyruvyl transferase family protein [Thermogutta sp.]
MLGVLTLHYGYNEGAILQAYALATVLAGRGAAPRIIDHRYPAKLAIYRRHMDRRKEELQKAIDSWLPLSDVRFESASERDTWRYIEHNCSGVVVGSDQVWRVRYSRVFFGLRIDQRDAFIGRFPNVYWPPRRLPVTKSAYAVSIGDADLGPIPRRDKREMADRLNDFRVIGVRDVRTAEFVAALDRALESRIRLCPDPTILMNWDTDSARITLEAKLHRAGVPSDAPIALQLTDPSASSRELSGLLAKSGYIVVGTGSGDDYSQVRLANVGLTPLEWVALFETVNVCITDRMHAFIFAMLKHCPCVVIDAASFASNRATRIVDLATRVGYLDNVLNYSASPRRVLDAMLTIKPPWDEVDRRLACYREEGMRTIDEIVGSGSD